MKHLNLLIIAFFLTACGDDGDRQEVLSKLRGLGASVSPLVSTPSASATSLKTVEVTVHAALPVGETATIEAFADTPSPFAVNLPAGQIQVRTDTVSYQAYPGFQILSFKANLSVPPAAAFERLGGAGQTRYGFILRSGGEEEKLVGNFLVYPEGAPELAWTNPDVSIVLPAADTAVPVNSEFDIAASTTDKNGEELKIGWFASGGEIKNRRDKTTRWTLPEAGEHTLIMTARGKKSRGFAMQVITVKAE